MGFGVLVVGNLSMTDETNAIVDDLLAPQSTAIRRPRATRTNVGRLRRSTSTGPRGNEKRCSRRAEFSSIRTAYWSPSVPRGSSCRSWSHARAKSSSANDASHLRVLGLADIPVRYVEEIDPLELRIIELEENLRRQGLGWEDEVRSRRGLARIVCDAKVRRTRRQPASLDHERNRPTLQLDETEISRYLRVAEAWTHPHDASRIEGAPTRGRRTTR